MKDDVARHILVSLLTDPRPLWGGGRSCWGGQAHHFPIPGERAEVTRMAGSACFPWDLRPSRPIIQATQAIGHLLIERLPSGV